MGCGVDKNFHKGLAIRLPYYAHCFKFGGQILKENVNKSTFYEVNAKPVLLKI